MKNNYENCLRHNTFLSKLEKLFANMSCMHAVADACLNLGGGGCPGILTEIQGFLSTCQPVRLASMTRPKVECHAALQ